MVRGVSSHGFQTLTTATQLRYHIHDNGGRPFKVEVKWPGSKAEVKVFKAWLFEIVGVYIGSRI